MTRPNSVGAKRAADGYCGDIRVDCYLRKRVISLNWNEDVADDRLDRVVAFATTHNWASGRVAIAKSTGKQHRRSRSRLGH